MGIEAIRLHLDHAAAGAHEPAVGEVGAVHPHKHIRQLGSRHAAGKVCDLSLRLFGREGMFPSCISWAPQAC